MDTCGTGGDGQHSFNISTAAALVLAAAGQPVAKHGNRAVSSRAGSADVLEALGVKIDLGPEANGKLLDELGICFLFAPRYHPAMKAVMPVRQALGTRTLFNLIGPLSNPLRPYAQVLGVYSEALLEPIAQALLDMGCERAFVVHGAGMDELALHGTSRIIAVEGGGLRGLEVNPEALGLAPARRGRPHRRHGGRERHPPARGAGRPRSRAASAGGGTQRRGGPGADRRRGRLGRRRAAGPGVDGRGRAPAPARALGRSQPGPEMSESVLQRILAVKREELAEAKRERPLASFAAELAPSARDFRAALAAPGRRYVLEVKKASPSRGAIQPDLDLDELLALYDRYADCISVLTDLRFFGGSAEDLRRARAVTARPLLRKDFTIDPYQVAEARWLGADAVLLIVAALAQTQLVELRAGRARAGHGRLGGGARRGRAGARPGGGRRSGRHQQPRPERPCARTWPPPSASRRACPRACCA